MIVKEQYVQIAPDSTGKKIRNIESYAVQQDGSVETVNMQSVVLARRDGSLVDIGDMIDLLRENNQLLRRAFNLWD